MDRVKHGVCHAELLSSPIHELDEPVSAPGDLLSESRRRVVGGLDHQSVQHLVNRERLLVGQPHPRTTDMRGFGAHGDLVLKGKLFLFDLLQDDEQVHQFQNTSRITLRVGLVFVQDLARGGVQNDGPPPGITGNRLPAR